MDLQEQIKFKQEQIAQLQTEVNKLLEQHGVNLLQSRYGVNIDNKAYVERYGKMLHVRIVKAYALDSTDNAWLDLKVQNILKSGKLGEYQTIRIYNNNKVRKALD